MARRTIILGLLFSFVYTPITLADSPRGAHPAGGQKPKPGPGQDTTPNLAGQLERLGQLRQAGQLTAEEFEAAKRKLLG